MKTNIKRNLIQICLLGTLFFAVHAPASVLYVDLNCTNATPPYADWSTAATNIQDAVDASTDGDQILVTNGIYQAGTRTITGINRVAVDSKTVTIQSVNGPSVTVIKGAWDAATNGPNAVRCVYLSNGSTLSGFTLTNGATAVSGSGGGVYSTSTSCVVTNCVIVGNSSYSSGGGAYRSTLNNCVLSSNAAHLGGGFGSGGGAEICVLNDCLLAANSATYGSGSDGGKLNNCTIVLNSGLTTAANGSTLVNSIIFYNSNASGYADCYQCQLTNCCTTLGFGNTTLRNNSISNAPAFVDLTNGNYRLQVFSPCVNTGTNVFAPSGLDLDGNPRIVGGMVDMGAYENQNTNPLHYVSLSNAAPVSPFTNWITAATNIQDAIDVASAGDFIVVSNGTYNTGARLVYGSATNRVVVDKAVTVQSVNGPATTTIVGFDSSFSNPSHFIRCVYLTNGASLIGFTLANGGTHGSGDIIKEQSGGGVWCETTSATLSNCVLVAGYANEYGGGAYQGTLNNCVISNNQAFISGGGTYLANLNNCVVSSNKLIQGSGGGAAYGALSNCLVVQNSAASGGGTYYSALNNCVVSNNSAGNFGGGVCFGVINSSLISSNRASSGGGAYSNVLINCVLKNNLAIAAQANGGGAYYSTLVNCTVVSNTASSAAAVPKGGGVFGGSLSNCIVYYNSAFEGPNFSNTVAMNFCCATPLPTNGIGNITNAPLFVNLTNDYHLQSNSPCINAGNNSYVMNTTDFDGNPRIIGGTVDIGAYEFQSPSSILSYAWAQQYGLPTDGSADNLDSDGDGMNNWQEWKAGTVPTNAASVLQLASPSNGVFGVTVTWQSVANVTYFLQRSTNLAAQPLFSSIVSNLLGQTGSTSYTDTAATAASPYFYRVGVQ